jgi:hypothetical protein
VKRSDFSPFAAFSHALRSVWNNRNAALHLSWPWMAILLPLSYMQMAYVEPVLSTIASTGPTIEQANQISTIALPYFIVTLLSFASVAVNWHRYVLRNDLALGWQRLRLDRPVWRYLGNILLLMLILIAFMLGPTVGAGLLGRMNGTLGQVALYMTMVVAIALSFRLSVKFPAIALDDTNYSFKTAYAQTKGMTLPIAVYAALIMLTSFILALVMSGIVGAAEPFGESAVFWIKFSLQFVASWIMLIFGITVLTSLYGYFAESGE